MPVYQVTGKINGQKIHRITDNYELAKDYEKQLLDSKTELILSNKKKYRT